MEKGWTLSRHEVVLSMNEDFGPCNYSMIQKLLRSVEIWKAWHYICNCIQVSKQSVGQVME